MERSTKICIFALFTTVFFIILKIVGIIEWPWWLALLPLYGPVIIVLLFLLVVLIQAIILNRKNEKELKR